MKQLTSFILAIAFSFFANAEPKEPILEGSYRVKGECAYRAKNGEYKKCVAWNTLKLKKLPLANEYAFDLFTNTFATTPGSCEYEGKLRLEIANGSARLVRSGAIEDGCHLSFQVTPRRLILEVPKSEEFEGCKSQCGYNSTLYSDPFPRPGEALK